jgi:hypothetical protein
LTARIDDRISADSIHRQRHSRRRTANYETERDVGITVPPVVKTTEHPGAVRLFVNRAKPNLPESFVFQVDHLVRKDCQITPGLVLMAVRLSRRAVAFRIEVNVLGTKPLEFHEILPDLLKSSLSGDSLVLGDGFRCS